MEEDTGAAGMRPNSFLCSLQSPALGAVEVAGPAHNPPPPLENMSLYSNSPPDASPSFANTRARGARLPSPNAAPVSPFVLTKPHYYTKPSVDSLSAVGAKEWRAVEDFTVGCRGVGEVTFLGA